MIRILVFNFDLVSKETPIVSFIQNYQSADINFNFLDCLTCQVCGLTLSSGHELRVAARGKYGWNVVLILKYPPNFDQRANFNLKEVQNTQDLWNAPNQAVALRWLDYGQAIHFHWKVCSSQSIGKLGKMWDYKVVMHWKSMNTRWLFTNLEIPSVGGEE